VADILTGPDEFIRTTPVEFIRTILAGFARTVVAPPFDVSARKKHL